MIANDFLSNSNCIQNLIQTVSGPFKPSLKVLRVIRFIGNTNIIYNLNQILVSFVATVGNLFSFRINKYETMKIQEFTINILFRLMFFTMKTTFYHAVVQSKYFFVVFPLLVLCCINMFGSVMYILVCFCFEYPCLVLCCLPFFGIVL